MTDAQIAAAFVAAPFAILTLTLVDRPRDFVQEAAPGARACEGAEE